MEKMVVDTGQVSKGGGKIFQGGNIFPRHVHNACICMELDWIVILQFCEQLVTPFDK